MAVGTRNQSATAIEQKQQNVKQKGKNRKNKGKAEDRKLIEEEIERTQQATDLEKFVEEELGPQNSPGTSRMSKKGPKHSFAECFKDSNEGYGGNSTLQDRGNTRTPSIIHRSIAEPVLGTDIEGGMKPETVRIDLDDIQEEVEYWNSAIVCYVMGANPPITVFEGFSRRVWGKLGVDKVALVNKGLFLVRFTTMENRDKVVNGPSQFFDSRPVFVKPWTQDMEMKPDEVKVMPIWVQLKGIDLKYWGEKSLYNIVSPIGSFVKVDQVTRNRERLQYVRALVEVKLSQKFPEEIQFINEKNHMVTVEVQYEWKPIQCSECKGMGHSADKCRAKKKQVWREKTSQAMKQKPQDDTDSRTAEEVGKKGVDNIVNAERRGQKVVMVPTANSFAALLDVDEAQDEGTNKEDEEGNQESHKTGQEHQYQNDLDSQTQTVEGMTSPEQYG